MISLLSKLKNCGANSTLLGKVEILSSAILPIDLSSDLWDVLTWGGRPGNRKSVLIHFSRFCNPDLKIVTKTYIASKRFEKKIAAATALLTVESIFMLDQILGARSLSTLKTADFFEVDLRLQGRSDNGLAYRGALQTFGRWLAMNFNLRIAYKVSSKDRRAQHGRNGTESGREEKLLPIEVIRDIFAIANLEEVNVIDRFYVNALVVDVALGCRISELSCLPLDCLLWKGEDLFVKVYVEKTHEVSYRAIPRGLASAVETAVMLIKQHTDEGRVIASKMRSNPVVDWFAILNCPEAIRYFTAKFAHEWTRDHKLVGSSLVWCSSVRKEVDIKRLLYEHGSFANVAKFLNTSVRVIKKLQAYQEAAKFGVYLAEIKRDLFVPLTSDIKGWKFRLRRNPNAISLVRMEECVEVNSFYLNNRVGLVSAILDDALEYQLAGKVYPIPVQNVEFEDKFIRKIHPVIIDQNGCAVLESEDALFVIPKSFLANVNRQKNNDFQMVSAQMFGVWLSRQKEISSSLFARYKIIDPRTGAIADFVWHDIRHWLNTVYKQGGLTDQQLAMIFGRKSTSQSQVYDQTLAKTRSQSLTDILCAVREGKAVGKIPDTYANLSSSNKDKAEKYLRSSVRLINRMPHGSCSLNFALQACPHNLSCFTCNDGGDPCNHLLVDTHNKEHYQEIYGIKESAQEILVYLEGAGGKGAPQYLHFSKVVTSTTRLLNKMSGVADEKHFESTEFKTAKGK